MASLEETLTPTELSLYRGLELALDDWEGVWDGEDDSIPGWVIYARQVMKESVGGKATDSEVRVS